jgi:chaperonin GroES
MAVNFTPLHDRILVRRIEEEETTRSGLVIPDTAKEKPQEGEVLAIGKGKITEDGTTLPLDVKAGDRDSAYGNIQAVRPGMQVLKLSAKSGDGMKEYLDVLNARPRWAADSSCHLNKNG